MAPRVTTEGRPGDALAAMRISVAKRTRVLARTLNRSARYVVCVALTPAQQCKAVSEGMALGLLKYGRGALSFDKSRLSAAFETAWRS